MQFSGMLGIKEPHLHQLSMLVVSLLLILGVGAHGGSGELHRHAHNHHLSHRDTVPSPTVSPTSSIVGRLETDLTSARQMIEDAHQALAIANKGRLAYPQWNQYKVNYDQQTGSSDQAPPLEYAEFSSKKISLSETSLDSGNRKRTTSESTQFSYTIPQSLADAARVLAEASPSPLPADRGVDISAIISKHRVVANDTNMPQQTHLTSNGLGDYIVTSQELLTDEIDGDNGGDGATVDLSKRASTDSFWLTELAKKGMSPFAPAGYKVFRNVKDYGAKGDGVTDDTAAINLAISDGGRCGADCGSSTIYPAFVYFPPGTYLVSSPIIQYYNTEFYGNPFDYPLILAASSFVGLGVITSDVYTGDTTEWYLNTNNFLRSIRNFKMDVTRTNPYAYVCAIHWQVAQGTSLENIIFYMVQGETTQQGVYMENGSGGFLSNLTFVGGNFGAYFGNQQFTTSQLTFINCKTALQIHWDWAWTMQDVLISNCTQGVVIVGGAGGPGSTGQSVGSLILIDTIIEKTETAILTSLMTENSTSFLLQNANFIDVTTAIKDNVQDRVLMAGGKHIAVDSWGFGLLAMSSSNSTFVNGQSIPSMNRSSSLTFPTLSSGSPSRNWFQRRRPTYTNIGMSQVVDVKAWGAVGDGRTDDTAVLNSILDRAANMSSIVYFPFGIYKITDTLLVPVGSRIIGQAWSQIMATGTKFSDELKPRVAVKVGNIGDVGIIEIQSLMFTVSGPTAGVILMQWNVHESTQGSAGMWDSHFRIGGAIGSGLQKNDCPKSGGVNSKCKAASLLLHLSSKSSAYLENIWIWTADHDLDIVSQDQISVYSARGVLVESQGPTWMYGTASEHNVLYQYQLSNAKDLYMGMIQTESPYFQPIPKAPSPFTPGLFPNDPTFRDCGSSTVPCAVSWALRILDSSTIYSMGSGLYSWFADYSQVCLTSETCQQRAVAISESTDVWLYNLVTKGIVEMVSPVNEAATLSASNINGFMASILAWVREEDEVIGAEKFPGFQIYEREALDDLPDLTDPCKTALSQTIHCSPFLERFQYANMGTYIDNTTETDLVCDAGCGLSLKSWFDNVSGSCKNQSLGYYDPTSLGGYVWAAYNQTCFKDPTTGQYCREVINNFPVAKDIASMSLATRCSYCFKQKYRMMQASPYTAYDEVAKNNLHTVYLLCFDAGPLDIPTPLYRFPPEPEPICLSETTYTVKYGDTCDTIALQYGVASAALQSGNRELIQDCSRLQPGDVLCLPLSCEKIYTLQDNDTCFSIDMTQDVEYGGTRKYNPWIDMYCSNLQTTRRIIGSVICLSPKGGTSEFVGDNTHTDPAKGNGYTLKAINPPENSTVAEGSAWFCGRWHTAKAGETCATICMEDNIPFGLFLEVNPSLSQADCDGSLKEGLTYCTGPDYFWNDADFWGADWPGSSAGPVDTSTG